MKRFFSSFLLVLLAFKEQNLELYFAMVASRACKSYTWTLHLHALLATRAICLNWNFCYRNLFWFTGKNFDGWIKFQQFPKFILKRLKALWKCHKLFGSLKIANAYMESQCAIMFHQMSSCLRYLDFYVTKEEHQVKSNQVCTTY